MNPFLRRPGVRGVIVVVVLIMVVPARVQVDRPPESTQSLFMNSTVPFYCMNTVQYVPDDHSKRLVFVLS